MRVKVTVSEATLDFLGPKPGPPVLYPPGIPVLERILTQVRDRRALTVVVEADPEERLQLDYAEWWTSRSHRDKHFTVHDRGAIWGVQALLRRWRWSRWARSWRFTEV